MTDMPRRRKLTAVVEDGLWRHVRGLAQEQGASLSAVVEEALREYTCARPLGTDADLVARLPRRNGRPSQLDLAATNARRALLHKRTGRPLGALEPVEERTA